MNVEEIIIPTIKVEVKLVKPFSVIKETLGRMGIANRTTKKLFPSCYAVEQEGKVFVAHFKELLKVPKMTESDLKRRNTIIFLLEKWGLISVEKDSLDEIKKSVQQKKIYILTKKQMLDEKWEICDKWHSEKKIKKDGGE